MNKDIINNGLAPIAQRITLTRLPLTEEFSTEKRHRDERGEAHLILNGPTIQRLGYITLLAGKGSRGNHWHRHKTEGLYVVQGQARVEFVCVESAEQLVVQLEVGDRLDIPPGLAHRLFARDEFHFVEYADQPYDPEDDIAFDFRND